MILRKLTADPAVAQSATTGLVSGLAEKGLAEITIDPEDRRTHVVSLTSEGKRGQGELPQYHQSRGTSVKESVG